MREDEGLDFGDGAALIEGLRLAAIALVAAGVTAGAVIGIGEVLGPSLGPVLTPASDASAR